MKYGLECEIAGTARTVSPGPRGPNKISLSPVPAAVDGHGLALGPNREQRTKISLARAAGLPMAPRGGVKSSASMGTWIAGDLFVQSTE